MRIHEVQFPRWFDDVMRERRTIFHVPPDAGPYGVGDALRLLAHPNFPRCKVGVLTSVRRVSLLAELDADLGGLCAADRAEYLARWDAVNPELPSADDPVVWRIEFRYGAWVPDPAGLPDPPEWSLAT
jgi:hypothetical protein